jgi:hypothetical protein
MSNEGEIGQAFTSTQTARPSLVKIRSRSSVLAAP